MMLERLRHCRDSELGDPDETRPDEDVERGTAPVLLDAAGDRRREAQVLRRTLEQPRP